MDNLSLVERRICSIRRRSRILAAANIRVAHAHVNNLVSRMAGVHDRYKNSPCPEKFGIF